jgi:hypothetical protein
MEFAASLPLNSWRVARRTMSKWNVLSTNLCSGDGLCCATVTGLELHVTYDGLAVRIHSATTHVVVVDVAGERGATLVNAEPKPDVAIARCRYCIIAVA